MQDNTNFSTISLDNLHSVAGGYHDPAGPPPTPRRGSGDPPEPQPQGTLAAHLGDILNRFADLAGRAAPQK
ncbi:MAG TPA: hypothetical protein VHW23_35585 [Kofleriaceae bacterium]|nr:hypothetical protein [Kofleriaceae bacterium]